MAAAVVLVSESEKPADTETPPRVPVPERKVIVHPFAPDGMEPEALAPTDTMFGVTVPGVRDTVIFAGSVPPPGRVVPVKEKAIFLRQVSIPSNCCGDPNINQIKNTKLKKPPAGDRTRQEDEPRTIS